MTRPEDVGMVREKFWYEPPFPGGVPSFVLQWLGEEREPRPSERKPPNMIYSGSTSDVLELVYLPGLRTMHGADAWFSIGQTDTVYSNDSKGRFQLKAAGETLNLTADDLRAMGVAGYTALMAMWPRFVELTNEYIAKNHLNVTPIVRPNPSHLQIDQYGDYEGRGIESVREAMARGYRLPMAAYQVIEHMDAIGASIGVYLHENPEWRRQDWMTLNANLTFTQEPGDLARVDRLIDTLHAAGIPRDIVLEQPHNWRNRSVLRVQFEVERTRANPFGLAKIPRTKKRGLAVPSVEYERALVKTALLRDPRFDPMKLPKVKRPEDIARLVRHIADFDQEHSIVVSLDNKKKVIAVAETGKGGQTSVPLSPRTLAKIPIMVGARGVVTIHNHPAADPRPSRADKTLAKKRAKQLACAGLVLLDSIVIGGKKFWSMRAAGQLPGGKLTDKGEYQKWPPEKGGFEESRSNPGRRRKRRP